MTNKSAWSVTIGTEKSDRSLQKIVVAETTYEALSKAESLIGPDNYVGAFVKTITWLYAIDAE